MIKNKPISLLFYCVLFSITACTDRPYALKTVAKSDIDLVADAHLEQINELLQNLMIKLYKRNPQELEKSRTHTIQTRLDQVFLTPGPLYFSEIKNQNGTEAVLLAFDPLYSGDRVFALIVGLTDMIKKSYGYQEEFFIISNLNQQDLYNSARNIEVVVWRLNHRYNSDGELFLLTNGHQGGVENLSFERLFGKVIATQDMMARITSDKTNRTINKVVHGIASATFLPVGL